MAAVSERKHRYRNMPGIGKEISPLARRKVRSNCAPTSGIFLTALESLKGKSALDPSTIDWIVANLQQKDCFWRSSNIRTTIPTAWRCKTELLFRLVDEWFIDMRWRDAIMKSVMTPAGFLTLAATGARTG